MGLHHLGRDGVCAFVVLINMLWEVGKDEDSFGLGGLMK